MAAEHGSEPFRKLAIKKLPKAPTRITEEDKFWRRYKAGSDASGELETNLTSLLIGSSRQLQSENKEQSPRFTFPSRRRMILP
jgi:hypothetical protein